jgi:hypothetical protein
MKLKNKSQFLISSYSKIFLKIPFRKRIVNCLQYYLFDKLINCPSIDSNFELDYENELKYFQINIILKDRAKHLI